MKDILRAYKYELKPDADQRQYLAKSFGCARYIWNELVANNNLYLDRKDGYDPKLTETKIKNEDGNEFLQEVSSVILQSKRIDFAETKKQFWSKTRKTKIGRMKYKSRKGRQSIRFTDQVISKKSDLENGFVILPKYKKPFKFINHRKFTGELRSVTVSQC